MSYTGRCRLPSSRSAAGCNPLRDRIDGLWVARAWKVCQLTQGGEGVGVLLLIDCGTDFFLKSLESERCNWREVVQQGWVNYIRDREVCRGS